MPRPPRERGALSNDDEGYEDSVLSVSDHDILEFAGRHDDGDLTQLNVVYELIQEGPLLLQSLATMVKDGGGVGFEGDKSGGGRRPNSTVSSNGIASIVGK